MELIAWKIVGNKKLTKTFTELEMASLLPCLDSNGVSVPYDGWKFEEEKTEQVSDIIYLVDGVAYSKAQFLELNLTGDESIKKTTKAEYLLVDAGSTETKKLGRPPKAKE